MDYNEYNTVTLIDEDGVETEFEVLGTLEDEGNTYVALVPCDSQENEFVVLKIVVGEDGEENLITIDDDDEFDKVSQMFEDCFMDECDLDEVPEEE
ncbi:MAG: DUF1292 domain-containing protein [Clostridia bacterium]|nr:DUF1292 domain-containing protein [Clostridia bacterium]